MTNQQKQQQCFTLSRCSLALLHLIQMMLNQVGDHPSLRRCASGANPGGGEAKQQAALSQLGGATETMFDDFDHADLVSLAKRYGIKRDGVQPLR